GVEPLPEEIAVPLSAPPAPVRALTGAPYRSPQAGLEPASVEDTAHASGGADASPGPPSPGSETATAAHADVETLPVEARDEPALPTGTGGDDRVAPSAAHAGVADLIPHLRAGSPALSPSVAPALGPVEVEPAPITEPDATRPIEPGAPQSQAGPAGPLPPGRPPGAPRLGAPPPRERPIPPTPPARPRHSAAPSLTRWPWRRAAPLPSPPRRRSGASRWRQRAAAGCAPPLSLGRSASVDLD